MHASPGKFQAPVQDTIPSKRITGRVLNLEDSTPLTGASVVNLRTGRGTTTNTAGIFFVDAKPGDSIRFSFAGKIAQTLAYMQRLPEKSTSICFLATSGSRSRSHFT